MLQTTSLTRGTFIQRATNLFRAAWAPCVKKYAWKILWERESFNFTFTSTKYLSRYYVYKRTYHFSQNNNHPRIMPRFLNPLFFLFLDAYCVYAKRKILGHCRRRRCCKKLSSVITKRWDAALFREGKPTHSSRVFASWSFPCEKEMRYGKWLKT